MNKLFNSNIMLLALALVVVMVSCAEPENPTATNMAYGNWVVDEYYVNNQSDGSSGVINRFTLERDQSFLMEDNNGVLTTGTWAATAANLTLTEDGAGDSASTAQVLDFEIVFMSYQKMHLKQTIESPTAGNLEIRYLMNHQSASTY